MTTRLLLPLLYAAIAVAGPISTSPQTPWGPPVSNLTSSPSATLFDGVETSSETPVSEPEPVPEFVIPQDGAGWLDFVFQYMYVGLDAVESARLRTVLLPQYERLAAAWQPATETPAPPPAPELETGGVMIQVTTSPAPFALPTGANVPEATQSSVSAPASVAVGTPRSNLSSVPEPCTLGLVAAGIALAFHRLRPRG